MLLMATAGIGEQYDPKTGKGAIGRNYCYQVSGNGVGVFFEDKEINPFMSAGASHGMNIDDFNGDNFDHSGLGFFGGAWISAGRSNGRPIASASDQPVSRSATGLIRVILPRSSAAKTPSPMLYRVAARLSSLARNRSAAIIIMSYAGWLTGLRRLTTAMAMPPNSEPIIIVNTIHISICGTTAS